MKVAANKAIEVTTSELIVKYKVTAKLIIIMYVKKIYICKDSRAKNMFEWSIKNRILCQERMPLLLFGSLRSKFSYYFFRLFRGKRSGT